MCARRSRYTELVSPLIVHAQHKLVERISENGGRADSQPHWSAALAANSSLPITAADYVQLQLRVVVDVGAESAAVADPLGNVAYSRMSLQHLLLCFHARARMHARTHTHTFYGPFSRTTRVSRYQKGKTSPDFTEARDSEWQWHQLGHMQVCTLLQTDNHASTTPLSFLQAGYPSCRPANSVKALKDIMMPRIQ